MRDATFEEFCNQKLLLARLGRFLLLCCVCGSCSGAQLRVNDARAEETVREIKAAETIFKANSDRFATLRELVEAGLVGRALADNVEFNHRFHIVAARDTYEAVAVPVDRDDRYAYVGWSFYVDESGVIRGSAYGKANGYSLAGKHDPPVRSQ